MSGDFSFKNFSDQGFYRIVNNRVVDLAEVKSGQRIIDLACGTGAVTRLILERLRGARDFAVIGIDHSSTSLRQAMQDLGNFRDSTVQFIQSRMERLSVVIKDSVDTIILCNAIHYIPDKKGLVSEITRTLRPGGSFVFNTSFFEGGHPPESEVFYRRWMLRALRNLKTEYGLRPVKDGKVESRRHLSPGEYENLLMEQGLRVKKQQIHTVDVPIEGWLTISQFEDFIEGALPGVPLDKASDCLVKGVREAFNELSISFVSRNWLEVVAVKV
jgi:ubiquinone/menaquinone biosynthesis C-methylase UbiE